MEFAGESSESVAEAVPPVPFFREPSHTLTLHIHTSPHSHTPYNTHTHHTLSILTILTTLTPSLHSHTSPQQSSNVPRGNVAPGNVNRKKAAKLRAKLVRGITYQDMEAGLHSLRFHSYAPEQNEGTTTTKSCIERLYNHSDEDEDLNVNL